MLVLTRKTGQKLIINDNIEIVILETKGDAVKVGVKAPRSVTIYREEIYEEIKRSNRQAGGNVLVSDLNNIVNMLGNQKQESQDYFSKFKGIASIQNQKAQEEDETSDKPDE